MKYYDKVNKTYYKLKEFIINRIQLINEYMEKCINITYETYINKYIEIKDDFNPTNKILKEEKESIILDDYFASNNDPYYYIKIKIQKYLIDNEFNFDIIFERDKVKKPKVIGKIVNKNSPKRLEIDFYSKNGQNCGKIGRRINVEFNNISLITYFNFDASLNELKLNSNFSYDEYIVRNTFYEVKEINQVRIIAGMKFIVPSHCSEIIIETPENEKDIEVIPSKMNYEEKEYTHLNNIYFNKYYLLN